MAAVLKARTGGGVAHREGAIANDGRGRFTTTSNLTDKQSAFVREYMANGNNSQLAAQVAGYTSPETEGYRQLKNWAVQQAIREHRERLIVTEGANVAWRTLREVMEDKDAKPEVRVRAATWTLEAAGHGRSGRAGEVTRDAKPLAEMTIAELEAFVSGGADRLRALHEQQARTIDAEPARLIDARDEARDAPADPPAEPGDTA